MRRFNIKTLMIVIGIIGVAFAALRSASQLAASLTSTLALAALVVASINVVVSGWGARRAYCLGFLLCGGTYFVASLVPGLRERLATEAVFDMVFLSIASPEPSAAYSSPAAQSVVVSSPPQQPGISSAMAIGFAEPESRWSAWTAPDSIVDGSAGHVLLVSSPAFRQIGHSMAALLAAVLGGAYARRRYLS